MRVSFDIAPRAYLSLLYQLVDLLYWRRREHRTCVWTGCGHRVPIRNAMGGVYASFHDNALTSRIVSVLGWSVPGLLPRDSVLRDLETVRYSLGYTSSIFIITDRYITAGTTGLSTPVKLSQIRKCLLQTQSLPYVREPPASDGSPTTILNIHLRMQKNPEPRSTEAPARQMELQRMVREWQGTTWFEHVTRIDTSRPFHGPCITVRIVHCLSIPLVLCHTIMMFLACII